MRPLQNDRSDLGRHRRLKVVKLNIDENEATPAKFGVRGIPTLMVFKNGENVATKVGALAKGQLTAFVNASLA